MPAGLVKPDDYCSCSTLSRREAERETPRRNLNLLNHNDRRDARSTFFRFFLLRFKSGCRFIQYYFHIVAFAQPSILST